MSAQAIDLTDMTFGQLKVIRRQQVAAKSGTPVQWLCKCKCGKEVVVYSNHLRSGKTKSCGCQQYVRGEDLTGREFCNLKVVKRVETPPENIHLKPTSWWLCKCKCGREVIKSREYLRATRKASCGCLMTQALRIAHESSIRQREQHRKAVNLAALPVSYNTHTCPRCGKIFETFGCGWAYKYDGKLYCRWSCVRAAEKEAAEAKGRDKDERT